MEIPNVTVELSSDEALVLYDWLVRFNAASDRTFEDQAEQRVLADLESVLESTLLAPLDPKYAELVAAARARVRDSAEKAR